MRTLKELYTLVLEHFDDTPSLGICVKIRRLDLNNIISRPEYSILMGDFMKRKPRWYNSWFYWNPSFINGVWWWNNLHPQAQEQRKKFLKHIINKL